VVGPARLEPATSCSGGGRHRCWLVRINSGQHFALSFPAEVSQPAPASASPDDTGMALRLPRSLQFHL